MLWRLNANNDHREYCMRPRSVHQVLAWECIFDNLGYPQRIRLLLMEALRSKAIRLPSDSSGDVDVATA